MIRYHGIGSRLIGPVDFKISGRLCVWRKTARRYNACMEPPHQD